MSSKVIIIDDEPLARSIVIEYIQHFPDLVVYQVCSNGYEGVKAIQQYKPDLIILDIQMPKINGFEMLELIENPPAVIFATAFDEYAIKAFDAHAIDYLLKPFNQDRFEKAIKKWREQKNSSAGEKQTKQLLDDVALTAPQNQRIVIKDGSKIKIIPVQDIFYLEAADDFVKVFTKEGYFLKNKTMSHFEQVLDASQFVRSHRSYIVNLQQITRIGYAMVTVYGMNSKVGNISYYDPNQDQTFTKPYSEETSKIIDQEVRALIDTAYERTKALLTEKKAQVEILAERLLEKEVLFQSDVEALIGKRPYEEKKPLGEDEPHHSEGGISEGVPPYDPGVTQHVPV